jgi:phosphoglycerate dehydrogenase-like enzyme
MRLAILDDYHGIAKTIVDWTRVPGLSVVAFRDHVDDVDELVTRLDSFDAVMRIRERTPFTRAVLDRLPRLKLILATGIRNAKSLDLAATDERGIVVCTTHARAEVTVELTWALILGLCRRIVDEVASVRSGGWQRHLGIGLAGRTLGVVGLGHIGVPVAEVGRTFGMNLLAWSPNMTTERAAAHGAQAVAKTELFARSDVVTVHMPHTVATTGIVDAQCIGAMQRHAYFINTSRSQLVDQAALIEALQQRRIAGAGLDVYESEPLPADHPYRTLTNVVATPHIGFVSEENMRIFFEQSLENLQAYLAGAPIRQITAAAPFRPDTHVAKMGSVTL